MKPIEPQLGFSKAIYGQHQPEYVPLPTEVVNPGTGRIVVSRWRPNLLERLRVVLGSDVFLAIRTFDSKLQPQRPAIGKRDMIHFLVNQ